MELIKTGTTDVQHFINQARGSSGKSQDPTSQHLQALSGNQNYNQQLNQDDEEKVIDPTHGKSNQELITMSRQELADQDRYLDVLEVIIKKIKYQGQDFGEEVKKQTKMIEKVSDQIDHTAMGLAKVDGRLEQLVSEMDFCKMWCVVVVEVILIIVIVCM